MSDWCPNCGSYDYEVYDSSQVFWENNDEGIVIEYIECLDCGKRFQAESKVVVKQRKVMDEEWKEDVAGLKRGRE